MEKVLKAKIFIKLVASIENIFEDEEILQEFQPFLFTNDYAEKMAEAAIQILFAQKEEYDFLDKEGELKN